MIVSGSGLVPYVDSAFRVEAGMAPVELVVSVGPHSAGKAADDDCAFCDLFDALNDEEEGPGPSGKAQAALEAPPAPTNLRFEAVTDSSCTVRWDAAEGATDYDVNYKPAVGGKWTNEPHRGIRLSNTINDLEPGTEYRWAVRAENEEGRSEWVFGPNFTTVEEETDETTEEEAADGQAPAAPTNLRFDAPTDSSCTVRWDAAAGATDYDVNYKPAVGGRWTSEPHRGTGLYNTINDLEPGTEYRWAVRAENGEGRSEWVFGPNFTTVGADGQVTIPDAKLRAAIEAALGKARGATITKAEMETLTTLETRNAGISDLTGLEFATNLPTLDLSGHNLTNISALSGLTKLWWLSLDGFSEINFTSISALSDISALSGLTKLRILYLGNNQITDISALSGLTNLTHLYLWDNRITDVSALSGLTKLTELHLNDNPLSTSSINDHIPALQDRGVTVEFDPTPSTITITDDITDDPTPVTIRDAKLRTAIAAALGKASGATITQAEMAILTFLEAYKVGISDLTGLEFATNLIDLRLDGNNISDIAPLSGLTNLTHLLLLSNNISDIAPLSGLTNLTFLWLLSNNISDIAPLSGLTGLTHLRLDGNNISDIAPLSGLTGLTHLRLDGNNISDIAPLSGLTNLTGLGLNFNNISDITVLSGLTNLTYLGLDGNNISDISMLSGLTKLTELGLDSNNISDISALSDLTNLTGLELSYNQIKSISALRRLTNLTGLELNFNNITDVSSLRGLTKLTELGLWGNPLRSSSINDHIPALERSGVAVFFDSFRESDFDIELVFLADFTQPQKRVIEYAARRWMSIIREDLPDYTFTKGWSGQCGDHSYAIPSGERIDDLRIYVGSVERIGDVRIHIANEEVVFEPSAQASIRLLARDLSTHLRMCDSQLEIL